MAHVTRSAFYVAMLSVVMSACSLTEIKCPDKADCDGVCADLSKDNEHCGKCGHACESGKKCEDGECVVSCIDGQVACDGVCVDLSKDSENCGDCGHACQAGEKCEDGMCGVSCVQGQTECDGACVDLMKDTQNCGECGVACVDIQACVSGTCTCPEGTTLCASECLDFEKLNLDNCTECKQSFCDPSGDKSLGCKAIEDLHVTTCTSTYVTCDSTHLDCDQKRSNGCETEIGNDNCGECGHACEQGRICKNGQCELACAENETNCDNSCLNLDALHWSDCDHQCAEGYCDSGELACTSMEVLRVTDCSEESIKCEANFLNCDGNAKNGCETAMSTENCGLCGKKCNPGEVCSDGVCLLKCKDGYEICNGECIDLKANRMKDCQNCMDGYCNSGTGNKIVCNVSVKESADNCGSCGKKCNVLNADNYCSNGVCMHKCKPGYHEYGDKCELDTIERCGDHNNKCDIDHGVNIKCESGSCAFNCELGYHKYKDTCEADSLDNCGFHNNKCNVENAENTCEEGKCAFTCDGNYHAYLEGCELNDISNCGEHGHLCTLVPHGVPKCSEDGNCDIECDDGFVLSNGKCVHGGLELCGNGFYSCDGGTKCCEDKTCKGICMMMY